MSYSPDVKVRAAAAGNPMATEATLLFLSHDTEIEVRSWVARNPGCPDWLLRQIADDDPAPSVRAFAEWQLRRFDH